MPTSHDIITVSRARRCLRADDALLLSLSLMPGFAPDGGPGAEGDDRAGLSQGQFDEPLYCWRPRRPDPGGQSPPRPVCHLGAGGEAAPVRL